VGGRIVSPEVLKLMKALRSESRMRERVNPVAWFPTEPLVVVLPSDHRLAANAAIDPKDLAQESFIGMSNTAPTLRVVIGDYLKRSGLNINPVHEVDNLSMAISLIASTRGVALVPLYVRNFLPWSVTSRPIKGDTPTIDLVVGYHHANTSAVLELFLSRLDELIARVSAKAQ